MLILIEVELMKVVSLMSKSEDSKRHTPQEALQDVLDDYVNGVISGKKIIIVSLDDSNGSCIIERTMAGIHCDEAIAMLEAAKYLILKETFE